MRKHSLFAWGTVGLLLVSACRPLGVQELPDTGPNASQGVIASGPLPAPAGTATPQPSPTDPPATVDPPSSGNHGGGNNPAPPDSGDASCVRNGDNGVFISDVLAAEAAAKAQHPEYFRSSACVKEGLNGNASWRDFYYQAVISNLNASGVSATNDQGGEIAIKSRGTAKGAGFSEQYQLLYSSACLHTCPDCYRATCTPSWF